MMFSVSAEGRVTGARVLKSSGKTHEHRMLDAAAVNAISKCPTTAALDASGQQLDAEVEWSYTWVLD